MSSSNPLLSDGACDEVAALLPWYVNGTLDGEEQRRVKVHIEHCRACRLELASLRVLADRVVGAPIPERSPEAAYGRLLETIQQRKSAGRGTALQEQTPKRVGRRSLFVPNYAARLALAAMVLLLLAPLGWRHLTQMAGPSFRTLSDSASTTAAGRGDLHLVFDEGVAASRIDEVLKTIGGELVGGRGPGNVYTIRLAGPIESKPDVDAALAYLRQQEGILLAEPIVNP
ncbi:zf-HC2 domain-containing protein [Methylococcus sp. EFPC2]|uniref:zf-HC2 domain-containing protein n=1 Tax=Methylococcus sp. EFPC2 TaxID=2812648 RepID=UPI0019686A2C|nr:zf-HC2 domain-containing protein [Methylococcus sp. EFPC2]QSA97985.1 zf-HC2 domain-containing protein [Methylococcus sp. EFPC2]